MKWRSKLLLDAEDLHVLDGRTLWSCAAHNGGTKPMLKERGKPARSTAVARLILRPEPKEVVDHINGNPWDNRRCNIRVCSQARNLQNTAAHRNKEVPFKGVSKADGSFVAAIQLDGVRRILGRFKSPVDAAKAYDAAAREKFGSFACLNFPGLGEQSALHRQGS